MDYKFQLHPDQASTVAPMTDGLYLFLGLVTVFFTVLIFLFVVYFSLKFRRRSKAPPPEFHGPAWLENGIIIPMFLITMVIFFWGAKVYFYVYRPPADALEVHVIGKQWMWKVQHPSGRREINTLHVPRGTPIQLTIASQDTIHSVYIPAFRIKMDAVPGRYTSTWFQPSLTGEYRLFCAEYCGTDHSRMGGRVIVMEPEAYQEWTSGASDVPAPAEAGAQLFASLQCVTCHGVKAPTMAGLFGSQRKFADGSTRLADEQYLRESILDSTAQVVDGYAPMMPSYRGQVTEEQLLQLIAYIKSLKDPKDVTTPPRAAPEQTR